MVFTKYSNLLHLPTAYEGTYLLERWRHNVTFYYYGLICSRLLLADAKSKNLGKWGYRPSNRDNNIHKLFTNCWLVTFETPLEKTDFNSISHNSN